MTSKCLRSQSHLSHLSVMMLLLSRDLSCHHSIMMFCFWWMLQSVRSTDDRWWAENGNLLHCNRSSTRLIEVTRSAVVAKFGATCSDDWAVVVAVAAVQCTVVLPPERSHCACGCKSMCVNRWKSIEIFRALGGWGSNLRSLNVFTIIVKRHAAKKLATNIKTNPNKPPSQRPRVATK